MPARHAGISQAALQAGGPYQQEVAPLLDSFICSAPHEWCSQRPLNLDKYFWRCPV